MTAEYDAIVYDLDGTLVRLDVDWNDVRRDVVAALRAADVDPGDRDLWDMLDLGDETGTRSVVEGAIAAHEREGAATSRRLPLADHLPHEVPVGVVSLNCETACHLALERHEIDSFVDVVVGRDSLAEHKPHPRPLLSALESLGVEPTNALFVGDSDSDVTTARRAGTDFAWASERHGQSSD